jgi:anti-sigma factor RsiW
MNLFEWPAAAPGETKPELVSGHGYSLVRWKRGGLEYWLVSDASGADLLKFAQVFAP